MMHWQPPPVGTHNGQITGYKIRYRKVTRKSDVTENIVGTQLSQLIEGEWVRILFPKRATGSGFLSLRETVGHGFATAGSGNVLLSGWMKQAWGEKLVERSRKSCSLSNPFYAAIYYLFLHLYPKALLFNVFVLWLLIIVMLFTLIWLFIALLLILCLVDLDYFLALMEAVD